MSYYSISNPDYSVSVSSWTYATNQVSFTATLKSGKYGFKLYDSVYGWYTSANTIEVSQTGTYTLATFQTSFNGGQATVTGADIGPGATLTVNGQEGTYISSTSSEAIFSIPALITPDTQKNFSLATNKTIDLSQKVTWGDSADWELSFDKEHDTIYSSSNAVCYIGVDIGANLGIQLTRIRYFPYSSWAVASKFIKGGKFQVSNDNSTWTDLPTATIDQTVHAGWNTIMIEDNNTYRYVRFLHSSVSMCKLGEIELTGIEMATVTVTDETSHTSDAIFSDGVNTQTFTGAVEYRKDHTPKVTAVTPDTGDVFGGYTITLTGVYLDVGTPSVVIDGIPCVVQTGSSSDTTIICDVAARTALPDENTFVVTIGASDAIVLA